MRPPSSTPLMKKTPQEREFRIDEEPKSRSKE